MKIEANRSKRTAFGVGLAGVAFALGLALPFWGHGQTAMRAGGALLIVAGVFLLASRKLIERDPAVSPDVQIPAERMLRMQLRITGATGILMGVSQFIPDMRMSSVVLLCAAAVSMAGVFKVPRRLFVVSTSPE